MVASWAFEGMQGGRCTQEMIDSRVGQLRAGSREAVLAGFNLDGFDLVVKDKIAMIKKKEAEREEDWKIINKEFPGQFEDADLQASLGDVPANSNWGNHAFSKSADAGGFEPTRRGW